MELLYEYRVVHVNVGKFDRNMDLAAKYGADLKAAGIPYLTVVDAAGKSLANQETGSLEDGPEHDPKKVLAFLSGLRAPPQDAQKVFADALARAKEAEKRVLLSFEAPW